VISEMDVVLLSQSDQIVTMDTDSSIVLFVNAMLV
jgi:hypothetical protein